MKFGEAFQKRETVVKALGIELRRLREDKDQPNSENESHRVTMQDIIGLPMSRLHSKRFSEGAESLSNT